MTNTPEHIKALQLKIWLSKPPMERLRQMMEDNEALMKFWSAVSGKNKVRVSKKILMPKLK